MGYLLSTFWFWLHLAAVLGLVVGWMTSGKGDARGWRGLIPWALALGIGGLVAVLQLLPQRLGYWFELGLLMLSAYVIGCCIAYLVRRVQAEPEVTALPATNPVAPVTARSSVTTRPDPVLIKAAATPELAVEPARSIVEPASAEAIEQAITGLSAPRNGGGDDLTKIYGVDPEIQSKLNELGIYHYDQVASLTPGNRRWLFRHLGHEGRFPSWWWRWRYDSEQLVAGKTSGISKRAGGSKTIKASGKTSAPGKTSVASNTSAPGKAVALAGTDTSVENKGPETQKPKAVAKIAAVKADPVEIKPVLAVAPLSEEGFEGTKPAVLAGPRGGKGDDLKRIAGIGKQNEGRLHGLGVWHFDQIAAWSAEEVKWVGGYLAFAGRIEREDWIAQAKVLASGQATAFSKRADAGEVATSRDDTGDDGQTNVIPLVKKPKPTKP